MSSVRPEEISSILREQLAGTNTAQELEEVGSVLQVSSVIINDVLWRIAIILQEGQRSNKFRSVCNCLSSQIGFVSHTDTTGFGSLGGD